MKIIIVGASGTMGTFLSNVLGKEHEIVRADRNGADVVVDITSTKSIEEMYKKVGAFDALICTAGPTYVGSWKRLTDKEFKQGVEGKIMGQIKFV